MNCKGILSVPEWLPAELGNSDFPKMSRAIYIYSVTSTYNFLKGRLKTSFSYFCHFQDHDLKHENSVLSVFLPLTHQQEQSLASRREFTVLLTSREAECDHSLFGSSVKKISRKFVFVGKLRNFKNRENANMLVTISHFCIYAFIAVPEVNRIWKEVQPASPVSNLLITHLPMSSALLFSLLQTLKLSASQPPTGGLQGPSPGRAYNQPRKRCFL